MKIHFLCYSDANFAKRQERLMRLAAREFDSGTGYTREQLAETPFYHNHRAILDMPFGAGFYLWKPLLVLHELTRLQDGDALFYMDSGQTFRPGIAAYLRERLATCDHCLTLGDVRNGDYTARDCFDRMGCDSPESHDITQLSAAFFALRKTEETVRFCRQWLLYCTDPVALISPYTLPNLPGFIEHRWDQSIMTNLAHKFGWTSDRATRDWCERVEKE